MNFEILLDFQVVFWNLFVGSLKVATNENWVHEHLYSPCFKGIEYCVFDALVVLVVFHVLGVMLMLCFLHFGLVF